MSKMYCFLCPCTVLCHLPLQEIGAPFDSFYMLDLNLTSTSIRGDAGFFFLTLIKWTCCAALIMRELLCPSSVAEAACSGACLLTCGRLHSPGWRQQSGQARLREVVGSAASGSPRLDGTRTEPPAGCSACCYLTWPGWLSGTRLSRRPQQSRRISGAGSALE